MNKEKSQERAPEKTAAVKVISQAATTDLKKSSIQSLEFQISAINEELMKPSDNHEKIKNLVENLEKMYSLIEKL